MIIIKFLSRSLKYIKPCHLMNFAHYCSKMSKTAIILLAEGAEEMEVVVTADILRRAGVLVTIASMTDDTCVKCSRDVKICADAKFSDAVKGKNYDAVILPGGVGWKKLAASAEVGNLLRDQESKNGVIAAICAAPAVLKAHGIAEGKKITSYPSTKDELISNYKYLETEAVVIDDNLITSRGPATSCAFGLAITKKLLTKETAFEVAKSILYQ